MLLFPDTSITLYRPSAVSWHWLCVSMVLCAMSILCKEQGLTVLVCYFILSQKIMIIEK